ncbi:hypothetical protein OF83DRAFT_1295682 [Amylostereum chailletii]|nr:hypothetical protein OF83DRAFT_1295682 [Amylostereum chailletii]
MALPTEYSEPSPPPRRPPVTMEEVPNVDAYTPYNDESVWSDPVIFSFGGRAGEVVGTSSDSSHDLYGRSLAQEDVEAGATPIWHPFASKMDWEIARWAKLRAIDGVQEQLGLSFKTAKDLNKVLDSQLPGARPQFKRGQVVIDGHSYDIYFRDVMECIKALYGDPEFAEHLVFAPERHYADPDQTIPMYGEMHTGKWWWRTQINLEGEKPGATIIPIIISSDKTQLTLFRNRAAYPVYLTIGNIPKDIRRKPSRHAQILLGYLPTSRLSHMKDAQTRCLALANIFHAALRTILKPLKHAGRDGVEMASGDGAVRRCHPIFAVFVGDYPEQCLVACCKHGDCPKKCILGRGDLGCDFVPAQRDLSDMQAALSAFNRGPEEYVNACEAVDMKPIIHPFWEDLPHADVFVGMTPDVLHQLYQGMVKHVISWVKDAFGEAEIDARFARLPQNHNLRLFSQGISILSRVSGQEHKDICRVLLGVVVDLRLPEGRSPVRLVRALRSLLDFFYLAQYPCHTSTTLGYLKDALKQFHANKAIFVEIGVRQNFNLPKLHSLYHYVPSIEEFGTTDNYSTEASERLHIDFAKDAYRATNHKDEYPQMTAWLLRREKIVRHEAFIQWRLAGCPPVTPAALSRPPRHLRLHITRFPSVDSVTFARAAAQYGATELRSLLTCYIIKTNNPTLSTAQVNQLVPGYSLPFTSVAAFHKVKFWHPDAQGRNNVPETLDAIHVRPAYMDTLQRPRAGRFDTALVNLGEGDVAGVEGYRVAQVRLVFALSSKAKKTSFAPHVSPPTHLAYVEWFTLFETTPEDNHLMYRIRRSTTEGRREASIIPVEDIRRSVVLIPKFGPVAPREWTTDNVLELCNTFYVNSFTDRNTYITRGEVIRLNANLFEDPSGSSSMAPSIFTKSDVICKYSRHDVWRIGRISASETSARPAPAAVLRPAAATRPPCSRLTRRVFEYGNDAFDYRTSNQSELTGALSGTEQSQQNAFKFQDSSYPSLMFPGPYHPDYLSQMFNQAVEVHMSPSDNADVDSPSDMRITKHRRLSSSFATDPPSSAVSHSSFELLLKFGYHSVRVLKARNVTRRAITTATTRHQRVRVP